MAHNKPPRPLIALPEDQLNQKIIQTVRAELYKGPIPSPEAIEKYAKLYPEAAKFFFETLGVQINHRIDLEKKALAANIVSEKRGSWFGFAIGALAIVCGFVLAMLEKRTAGLSSIIAGVSSLVAVFIVGKLRSRKELDDKR